VAQTTAYDTDSPNWMVSSVIMSIGWSTCGVPGKDPPS
jgi:hypothetical protein